MTGTVLKSTGSWYQVTTLEGKTYSCRIKGKFRIKGIKSTNPIAVGDQVEFKLEDHEDSGVIHKIIERKNYLIRKSVNLSKKYHILASNLDGALLMATLVRPKTFTVFMDRFLVSAEAFRIPVHIIFNKVDLYGEEELAELEYLELVYQNAGYTTQRLSATEETDFSSVVERLKDKVTLIAGHSGVGKSTLVNKIQPDLDIHTKAVSESHGQGQHTTTFAEMHPLSFGGAIIDTPGIRGFGIVDVEKNEISHFFPEIFEISSQCKFNNCLHIEEPGCAVKEALENHELASTRYHTYLSLVNGDEEENNYRNDPYA